MPPSPQVYLITGASTGFGALIARALAKEGHTVYAGMYSHSGDTKAYEEDIAKFAEENKVDLRPVALNLLFQKSINSAVNHVLSSSGRLDVVVHNAGHMHYGPSESFSPEQYLDLYDVNVIGAHRLNLAILPHMRPQRSGHLIWISSSSVYGAKSPMLGGYFAAKAAMDSLAQTYARELNPWGIETTIVQPGVFTSGTDHFKDAMKPAYPEIVNEYDEAEGSPMKGVMEQVMAATRAVVPEGTEPQLVADAVVEISRKPRGQKPYRVTVDVVDEGAEEAAAIVDFVGKDFYRRLGMGGMLKVAV